MNSERFEAFIDAIIAIVLTIIVLEITMAHRSNWEALLEIKLEFIAYIVSFIVCFNYWLFNNNLFHLVKKVDYKVIWTMGISLFIFSLIPYLTKFVAENFYSFVPQALYGTDYLMIIFLGLLLEKFLKDSNPGNEELYNAYDKKNIFRYDYIYNRIYCGLFILASSNNNLMSGFNTCQLDFGKFSVLKKIKWKCSNNNLFLTQDIQLFQREFL